MILSIVTQILDLKFFQNLTFKNLILLVRKKRDYMLTNIYHLFSPFDWSFFSSYSATFLVSASSTLAALRL